MNPATAAAFEQMMQQKQVSGALFLPDHTNARMRAPDRDPAGEKDAQGKGEGTGGMGRRLGWGQRSRGGRWELV